MRAAPDVLNHGWQELVLRELLRLAGPAIAEGERLPDEVRPFGPDDTRARPDAVAFSPDGSAERMHIYRRPWNEALTKAGKRQRSAVEEATDLCRRRGIPLALLTNGPLWVLVHARAGEAPTVVVFDADLWLEERDLLRAFATLLSAQRVLKPPRTPDGSHSDSLAALFTRSAEAQAEITNTLGSQVLRAVELLVGELSRLDRESGRALLADVTPRDAYRAALSVMMRLVFLLYAEDQKLLPVGSELYARSYSVGGLYDLLNDDSTRHGKVLGDRRAAAWPRLLATFAAVYGGSEHDEMRVPPYGGTLFDPHRFPWLPDMRVTDLVVHEILDALLMLRRPGKGAERLSYKGLNVEQIGHVYEGLLEFSCVRVDEPYVGLFGKKEPELPLAAVEQAYERERDFAAWVRKTCDASATQVRKALAADITDVENLDTAVDNDRHLAERAAKFAGLLRRDLRKWPTVFPAGSLIITKVDDRRSTGTHYTPRKLAEEIVEHTLAPLCYSPGPADGAEQGVWRARPWKALIELKVLDPAMGSGAFLVSACRYLADRVIEAWDRDGLPDEIVDAVGPDADRDDLVLEARRRVAASSIYGVDRDEQAVELAKLSLWLVTLAKDKPFSFLDHALRCGDSLIGVVSEDQLTAFDLDPVAGRAKNSRLTNTLADTTKAVLKQVEGLRKQIEAEPIRDAEHGKDLARKLSRTENLTSRLRLAADAVVAAALAAAADKKQNRRPHWEAQEDRDEYGRRLAELAEDVEASFEVHTTEDGEEEPTPAARDASHRVRELTTATLTDRRHPIRPFHWLLEFPEAMRHGGFDAVVGNPPFVGGQKLTGSVGDDYREYLVEWLAHGKRGSADLCSYFLLRNLSLTTAGRTGIIATNTIAQGDTREVGLDRVHADGWAIYRAVKSQPWIGTASLEVSLLWAGHTGRQERLILDGRDVTAITPSLDEKSGVTGNPFRLIANADHSFIGSYVLGKGFILEPDAAQALIDRDPRNKDVLFPYLTGEDLNQRWDSSASRWIINFHDWSIEKSQDYPEPFAIVEREVKPIRLLNNRKTYRDYWWQYGEKRPAMLDAITDLDQVIAIALVSRLAMPSLVTAKQVLAHKLCIFSTDRLSILSLPSSAFHYHWAWRHSSTMKADLNYSPSDVYETLPQPHPTEKMQQVGHELNVFRTTVMSKRRIGLTALYNLFHNKSESAPDISQLREIHAELDRTVLEAYALDEDREPAIRAFEAKIPSASLPPWGEIELGHGFHGTRQGTRFTISPAAQAVVLDKLLALNHYRHQQEMREGIQRPKKKSRPKKPGASRISAPSAGASAPRTVAQSTQTEPELKEVLDDGLFPPEGALF
ncbi:DNA methyltransferase [Sphaerisporangium sp. NPDC051017]|uniref:Eco57I restriction-modification methylase domain-containing protein n=1 Tax=Sphaerisporangium sp. NPDC051017 TaxID=3154636 RepID=UPI00342C0772